MAIPVLVNGAFGRMGQLTTKTIQENPKFELVGQTGREYNLLKAIKDSQARVVIDFTNPESVFKNACIIIEAGAHPVIGTTGLSESEIQDLQKRSALKKLGGIIAPNFSLGATLLMKTAQEIVKYLPDVEIIELHHPKKADSPSGTALRSAELIAANREQDVIPPKPTQETVPGARGALYKNVPIHSVRLPGLLAHEQIIFGNIGETLTLRLDSIDRACFMPGICLACEKVVKLDKLVYGLEGLL